MASITWSWIFICIFQLVLAQPGFAAPMIRHNYEALVRRAVRKVFIRDEYSVAATKSAVILAVSISASVVLFACILALFLVFRRSKQHKVTEPEGNAVSSSQRSPWWIQESKNEKASDRWWASPRLSTTSSQTSNASRTDPQILQAPPQIPSLVLNGKPLKKPPTRPHTAVVGAPRSPAGRRRNWVRHPFLPPKTPVDVLFAVGSKSRPSPPHRRPAPPAPLKLRDHRPRKPNKIQRLSGFPLPTGQRQLETVV